MRNSLILHGHFYQPPRENPFTGLVPLQESAAPFHDWNHRITRECYAANTASRFLHYDGRIEDIVNNYEILSFNFGPTLFWWLRSKAPHVYEAILEADRHSVERNDGHGNAIAQAYNHTILPLDSPEDARLQISWGLKDFRFHFGRDAEGIWLPETAVNGQVLDLLIDEGVRFIILSPWQAEAIHAEGTKEKEELDGEPAPSWRPYRIDRPAGSLAVFFYNHELAEGISFGHYLQNADSLYTRLLSYHNNADPAHLVHAATDGEVYGHHEPFGDMCLAALRKHVEQGDKFHFTNYGRYLAEHPPQYEVKLLAGEEQRGTSWSCVHGVSRWYKDCGCSTGGKEGWNQKWRSPLRQGLEALSTAGREIYAREMRALTHAEPEEVADRYIDVLTGSTPPEEFAAAYLRPHDEERQRRFFNLLEAFRYRMFMFTSCGWFFNDISGLEPRQNIHYAYKTVRLFQPYTDRDLYGELAAYLGRAKSNISSRGTGADLLAESVPRLSPGLEAAVYYFLKLLTRGTEIELEPYGFFGLVDYEVYSQEEKEAEARFTVSDNTTGDQYIYTLSARTGSDGELHISAQDMLSGNGARAVDLGKLPAELRRTVTGFLTRSTVESFSASAEPLFDEARFAVIQCNRLNTELPGVIRKSAELSLSTLLRHYVFQRERLLETGRVEEIEDLLSFAVTFELQFEKEEIRHALTDFLWDTFEHYAGEGCPGHCELLVRLIRAFSGAGLQPDLTIPQKHVFSGLRQWRRTLRGSGALTVQPPGDEEVQAYRSLSSNQQQELHRFIELADTMWIYADDLKRIASSPE
jgi:hypothetical protein